MIKTPEALTDIFGKDELDITSINPAEYAHIIIDVQRAFCDPDYGKRGTEETRAIAHVISEVADKFRATSMSTYIVYLGDEDEPHEEACGGLFIIKPQENDFLIPKFDFSAFDSSNLGSILRANGVKGLIVSGFNLSSCVDYTVAHACMRGYPVIVMNDCVGNDSQNQGDTTLCVSRLKGRGAQFANSAEVLKLVKKVPDLVKDPAPSP